MIMAEKHCAQIAPFETARTLKVRFVAAFQNHGDQEACQNCSVLKQMIQIHRNFGAGIANTPAES